MYIIYFTLFCALFSEEMRFKWDFFRRNAFQVGFLPKKCVLSGISSEEMRSKWDFFRRNKLTFVCNNTFGYKNHIPDAKKMVQQRHIGSIINDIKNTKVRHIGSVL